MAHAVDLLVYRGVLFYISIGSRNVRFRLVVVVVRDEILDGVLRKKTLHLRKELRCQCLVGRENQRWTLLRLDDLRHGEGLARAGDAEQHLVAFARVRLRPQAIDEIGNRSRLIACGSVLADELESLPAFGFFRPRRTMRHERGKLRAGHRWRSDGELRVRFTCPARHHAIVVRHAGNIGAVAAGFQLQASRQGLSLPASFRQACSERGEIAPDVSDGVGAGCC